MYVHQHKKMPRIDPFPGSFRPSTVKFRYVFRVTEGEWTRFVEVVAYAFSAAEMKIKDYCENSRGVFAFTGDLVELLTLTDVSAHQIHRSIS